MPSAHQMTTEVAINRYAQRGGHTVGFEPLKLDCSPAPFFVGLPGRLPSVTVGFSVVEFSPTADLGAASVIQRNLTGASA